MPTIADLRAANPWAEDVSDLELLNYRAQQTGTSLEDAAKAFGVKYKKDRNPIAAGLSAGVDELQGLGYGAIGAGARAVGLDSAADWADKNVRINQSEAQFNGRPDLENIEYQSLGSAPSYLGYQVAKQIPMLAGTLAASAVVPEAAIPAYLSRGLATVPRVVGGGGLRAGMNFAERRAALDAGNQFARIGAASYPMSVGSLYNEAVERGDPSAGDAYAAFAGGVPYAAAEAVMPAMVNRGLRPGGLGFTGNLPTRMAKAAGVDALGESGTELFQNEMEMGFAGPLTDEQIFSRRLNSAVAGGLVGGSFGSLAGIRKPVMPGEETDLLGGNPVPGQVQTPTYDLYTEMSPIQDRINANLGVGRGLSVPRGDVKAAFNQTIDPTVVVDPQGNPYVSDKAADFYDYNNRVKYFGQDPQSNFARGIDPTTPVYEDSPAGRAKQAFVHKGGSPKAWDDYAEKNDFANLSGEEIAANLYDRANDKNLKRYQPWAAAHSAFINQGDVNVDQENVAGGQKRIVQTGNPKSTVAARKDGAVEGTPPGGRTENEQGWNVEGSKGLLGDGTQTEKTVSTTPGQQGTGPMAGAATLETEQQAAVDLIKAVDAGGIPLNPAKLRTVAQGLGLEVSRNAKPEETIQRIREAVGRINTEPTKQPAAPAVVAPAKPTSKEDLPRYKQEMQQYLTANVDPKELAAFVGSNGMRAEDGSSTGYSFRALAALDPEGVSHVTMHDRAKKAMGKIEVAAQNAGIDYDTALEILGLGSNDVLDLGTQAAYEGGARTVRAESDDFDPSAGYERGEALGENEKGAIEDQYEEDTSDKNAVGSAEFEQVPDGKDARAEYARKWRDYKGNPIKQVDIDDAAEEYNDPKELKEGDLRFEELNEADRLRFVKAYIAYQDKKISARLLNDTFAEIADEARKPEYSQRATEEGSTLDEVQDGLSSGDAEQARFSQNGETQNPTTVEKIGKQLKNLFFSKTRFDNKVTVVNTIEELPEDVRQSAAPDGSTQAFVMPNGRAYMIASNIEQGQELAVFLHEVGVHLGMEGLIGKENFVKLAKQVGEWSGLDNNSQEVAIAKKAYARVVSAETQAKADGRPFEESDVIHELVAYFVEEAVNAGVNPTAVGKAGGPIYNWFRTMWAGVKAALRKFGLDRVDNLTAKNIVDLAYGAASLELEGTWHGTAADFRRFDHAYMGTGEGAQAFGWGTYLAQRPGIAKEYWQADMKRKKGYSDVTIGGMYLRIKSYDDYMHKAVHTALMLTFPNENMDALAYIEDSLLKNYTKEEMLAETANGPLAKPIKDLLNKIKVEVTSSPRSEGSLMRTSVAATEDEMLDWDNKQRPAIQEKLDAMPDWLRELLVEETNRTVDEMTGEDVYLGLKALEIREGYVAENMDADTVNKIYSRNKNDIKGAEQVVSTYLDQMGIKGIQFLDAVSRKQDTLLVDQNGKTTVLFDANARNTLAFSNGFTSLDEAIADAKDQAERYPSMQDIVDTLTKWKNAGYKLVEANRTRNLVVFNDKNIIRAVTYQGADRGKVRFSKSASATTAEGFFSNVGGHLDELIANPKGTLSKLKLGWMTLEQIADRTKSAAVKAYVSVMNEMGRYSKNLIYQAAKIDQNWSKLSEVNQNNLSDVMRKATRMGFDPQQDMPLDEKQQALFNQYKALPDTAKSVYVNVRDHYAKLFEERKAILMDAANKARADGKNTAEVERMFAKIKGPYFPLMRIGNWYAIGMSKEVSELKYKVDAGEASEAEQARYDELRKDESQYIAKAFESRQKALRAAKEFKAKYGESYFNATKTRMDSMMQAAPDLATLQEYISSELPQVARDDVRNMLAQMYFDMAPDRSPLKQMMKREGIYGEEEDMRKVFAASTISMSHYISRIKYANDMSEALLKVRKQTNRDEEMTHVYNELIERSKLATKSDESPVIDALVQGSYFANLGLSPAFVLTNMTQVPMITAPWLGARYGLGKVTGALSGAFVDAAKIINNTRKDGGWLAEYDWSKLFPKGSNEDRLLTDLLDRNLLDITIEHDFGTVARMGRTTDKAIKIANIPVRVTETANRLSTGLAAYRLEMAKSGNHDAAVEMAAKAISETQLNYSALNAPRYMQSVLGSKGLARLVFQFRKYQQGMVYLITKSAYDAVKGESAQVKREARNTLFGMLATTGLMAGATGLPFAGSAFWVANIIGGMFDDDDEPFDAETTFRNYLAGMFSDEIAAAVSKGLPTLLGADISGNVGQGNIGMPLPFMRNGKKPSETLGNALVSAAGAPFQTLQQVTDGLGSLLNGDFQKAAEAVPLKGAKSIVKAYGLANEGMLDSRGNVILPSESFSTWDIALRSLGFAPTKVSEYFDANNAMQSAKQAAKDTRNELLRRYSEARLKGEDTSEFQEEIMDFNTRHPEKGIRIDQSSLIKSVQQRRKMAAERTETGLRRDKTSRPYLDRAAFADGE